MITLTNSVSCGSFFLISKAFLFGSVSYEFQPNVVKVDKPAKLFHLLRTYLDLPLQVSSDYLCDSLTAYYLGTRKGIRNFLMDDEHTHILLDDVHHSFTDICNKRAQAARRIA